MTGSRYGTDPVSRHHRKDLALAGVELGDQVGRAGHAIGQLDRVERISGSGGMLHGGFEVDALTRAQAREGPAFAIAWRNGGYSDPEGTEQVFLISDAMRRHDDGGDRLVDDLLLRAGRNAARFFAPAQLPDQLRATRVELRGGLLRRPSGASLPRRADHR